ncbi:septation protein SepH [Kocuria sp. M1R5S2]|uniref:septation protein SepH n=1 Tax=Kocuria rhizosphaerae TaxID=3376285 RepID=UPI0037AC809B
MEQLRLAGVHDDGEHLVVEDEAGTRHLLRIDQELRLAVQRARRMPAARQRGAGRFGPREIQARFRAGATVDDIVAESGWEAGRVRRYEWPILAERAHVAAEARKVELGQRSTHRGYHSVFEGEPLTLGRAVTHRAEDLGVDATSFEWDSWQREDQLWTVVARFTVTDPAAAPVDDVSQAEWLYNPANQSVRPTNTWAEALTEPERQDTPLSAGLGVLDGGLDPELTRLRRSDVEADELLDVLQARRGQRIGADVEGDDALAELLGRGMGHVERRPRPLAAPEDTPVFDRPFQPATPSPEEPAPVEAAGAAGPQGPEDAPDTDDGPSGGGASEGRSGARPAPERDLRAAAAGPAPGNGEGGRAATGQDPAGTDASADAGEATGDATAEVTAAADGTVTDTGAAADADRGTADRPRPRNRTAKARRSNRSSVPSWDEIVFGSSSD